MNKGSVGKGEENGFFVKGVDSDGPRPKQKSRLTKPLPTNTLILWISPYTARRAGLSMRLTSNRCKTQPVAG